jgi:ectoine hydroxylase-related dioxygenase (phytanoyl-CoA dioxygenase family)
MNGIDLDSPYPLSQDQIESFRERGFVKLKEVLSPQTIEHYGKAITEEVKQLNKQTLPMSERNTYQRAFLQVMNIWTKSEVVKEFAFSKKLARIAAQLMGVKGVRMYHDQALYKEPGGGFTPWHADQYYWPLSNSNSVTAWVPLQATPKEMGPLAFSVGSHRVEEGRDLEISDESERKIQQMLSDRNLPLEDGPFDLGELSFHSGWTYHRAGPNTTENPRAVMTIIYVEDGIKIAPPTNRAHPADMRTWMPGAKVGDDVATNLNPILWHE